MAGHLPCARLRWSLVRGSVVQEQEVAVPVVLLGVLSQRLHRPQGLPVELWKVQLQNQLSTQCWSAQVASPVFLHQPWTLHPHRSLHLPRHLLPPLLDRPGRHATHPHLLL